MLRTEGLAWLNQTLALHLHYDLDLILWWWKRFQPKPTSPFNPFYFSNWPRMPTWWSTGSLEILSSVYCQLYFQNLLRWMVIWLEPWNKPICSLLRSRCEISGWTCFGVWGFQAILTMWVWQLNPIYGNQWFREAPPNQGATSKPLPGWFGALIQRKW